MYRCYVVMHKDSYWQHTLNELFGMNGIVHKFEPTQLS